jgi:hypothetical protein
MNEEIKKKYILPYIKEKQPTTLPDISPYIIEKPKPTLREYIPLGLALERYLPYALGAAKRIPQNLYEIIKGLSEMPPQVLAYLGEAERFAPISKETFKRIVKGEPVGLVLQKEREETLLGRLGTLGAGFLRGVFEDIKHMVRHPVKYFHERPVDFIINVSFIAAGLKGIVSFLRLYKNTRYLTASEAKALLERTIKQKKVPSEVKKAVESIPEDKVIDTVTNKIIEKAKPTEEIFKVGQQLKRGKVTYEITGTKVINLQKHYLVKNLQSGEVATLTEADMLKLFPVEKPPPTKKITTTLEEEFVPEVVKELDKLAQKRKADLLIDEELAKWAEMQEAGALAYGQELPKRILNVNLEKFDEPYKVKKLIFDTAERYKQFIEEAKRGRISWGKVEQLKAAVFDRISQWIGMPPEKLTKLRKGKPLSVEEAAGMDDVVTSFARALVEYKNELARLWAEGKISHSEALAKFLLAERHFSGILAVTKGGYSEAARTLQYARKLKTTQAWALEEVRKILEVYGGEKKAAEIWERFSKLDLNNPLSVSKFVRDIAKPPLRARIFEVWVNSLLSAPWTQVKNIVSGVLNAIEKPIQKGIAAAWEIPISLIERRPRQIFFKEIPHEIKGMFSGFPEGVRKGVFAFMNELRPEQATKLEYLRPFAIKGRLGRVIRMPGRILNAADEFIKAVIFESEKHALAYRKATLQGLKGEAKINKITELIANPTSDIFEKATFAARYRTFQQELGRFGRAIQSFRSQVPGFEFILPFTRTPVNIFKYGVERTPLAIPGIAYKIATKRLKGIELSEALAKATIGSAIALSTAILTTQGYITGAGPTDPRERAAFYREGKIPYAIKIFDKWISYGWIEPFGTVVGVIADFVESFKYAEEDEKEEIVENIIYSIARNTFSKTYLRGVSEFFSALRYPERFGSPWMRAITGTIVPTGVAHLAWTVDPYLRDARGIIENIKSRIPWLSKTLLPRRDIWGNPIKRPRSEILRHFLLQLQVSQDKASEIDKELIRLKIYIDLPRRKIGDIKLTSEEYDDYIVLTGSYLQKYLEELMTTNYYRKLKDDLKIEEIRREVRRARREAREDFMKYYLKGKVQ